MRPWIRWSVAGALLVAAAVGTWYVWHLRNAPRHSPAPVEIVDPRDTYAGPFRNVASSVGYLHDDTYCADCHLEHCEKYARHPMGRSLVPVDEADEGDVYSTKHRNPFKAFDSLFHIIRMGDGLIHRQVRLDAQGKEIFTFDLPIHYVVGSAVHGKSYISDKQGYLFMSPISWYSAKQIWDNSPLVPRRSLRGRPVLHECLFCHSNYAAPVEGSINRFQQPVFKGHGIGCERCHGPGSLHVQFRSERIEAKKEPIVPGDWVTTDPDNPRTADFTIVNPRHLPPALRDAVCEQCHLEGRRVVRRGRHLYDFRPGLRLDSVWSIFVDAERSGQEKKIVNHVEQMHLSRCWQKTSGPNKLSCISCHDPHWHPPEAEKPRWYRSRCQQCHGEPSSDKAAACSESLAVRQTKNGDNCYACHMPRFRPEELSHGAFTDHRILRTPDSTPTTFPHRDESGYPVTHFHRGPIPADDVAYRRDLAIALYQQHDYTPLTTKQLLEAIRMLDDSLREYPEDWPAREVKGKLLQEVGFLQEALEEFRTVVDARPEREVALGGQAEVAQKLKRVDLAVESWQKLIALNPYDPYYRANLGFLLGYRKRYDEAIEQTRKAVQLFPESVDFRKQLVALLEKAGRHQEARHEARIIERLQSTEKNDRKQRD